MVTPDEEEWEQDYNDLRDFLETFGKEYPAETGFMFAPDKSEDHVVESDEDMIGKSLLLLLFYLEGGENTWSALRCSELSIESKSPLRIRTPYPLRAHIYQIIVPLRH